MNKLMIMLVAVLLVAAVGVVGAVDKKPAAAAATNQTATQAGAQNLALPVNLSCVVQGSPVEFPNDFIIKNAGPGTVATGTKLSWEAPGGYHGIYTLTSPLGPNDHVMVSNVLGGGLGAGTQCSVKIVTLKPGATLKRPAQMEPIHTGNIPVLAYRVSCEAAGSPVEFPDDLRITNNGSTKIPAGKVIHWELGTAFHGDYTLANDLGPGSHVNVNGVLGGGVGAGSPCTKVEVK